MMRVYAHSGCYNMWCALCGRWSDENHEVGNYHKKNLRNWGDSPLNYLLCMAHNQPDQVDRTPGAKEQAASVLQSADAVTKKERKAAQSKEYEE